MSVENRSNQELKQVSKDIVELAKAASEKLDQKLLKQNESKIAARLYVEAVLDQHAKLKLPQLHALPETEQLMKQYAVSKNMLATALTEARAKRKAEEPKSEIKVPPRKRRRTKKSEAGQHSSSPDLLSGRLQNSPMSSGRVANGTIADL
ncbi:hypothetical protein P8Q88_14105 [Qipengyuania sp. XHP0207]|uniref:hypothetical protein n=1 Tax=Qipengyuania sp. XHP0207 TaxID=3038078 RepID=UPI00241D6FF2|nr:hypothetical protein [Qipengyuania sp. XHP0207]MDG5749310.1 hypothetical protein [Qipengyuania sp. XHP0207]